MEKKFNFTQARIKTLPLPDKGRFDYMDTEISKLVCRVSHTGAKSFIVTKRVGGKLRNITIGKFPDINVNQARKKARGILEKLSAGVDPVAEKKHKQAEKTKLADVLELYLSGRDLKPYTVQNYRYKLKLGFEDWLDKPVSSITEEMVLKRHKLISQRGKTTANTTMRVLRLTLNYANAVGMIDNSPTDILSKARLWHRNKRKSRIIPADRLGAWHEAVYSLANQKAKVYLLMALYMGFRSSELLKLEWARKGAAKYSYIDLKTNTVLLYDPKNHIDHVLSIPAVILPHIEALKDITGDDKLVFSGEKANKPMSIPTKQIKAVIRATGIEFSSHDCRRTFATISEAVGLPTTMIKRLLNHVTSNDVTGGYIITEAETLREAINKVADYIQARVTQKDNVIQLQGNQ